MKIGYARCSKEEQADALQSQVFRLRDAGCEDVIQELVSGGNNEREGILRLLTLIKRKQIKEVVVTRADRLTRDLQFGSMLLSMAAQQGVTITALDGGQIETETPQGFLTATIALTMAEHERRMVSQRLKSQFAAKRKQGHAMRRRCPFGYEQIDGKLQPHPENWEHALRVIEELKKHKSFSKVARDLPTWCPWTPAASNLVFWWVAPTIKGHVGHLWDRSSGKSWGARWEEIHRDMHPALITEAEWRRVTIQLRQTTNRFKSNGADGGEARHALTGLLKCNNCGHRLTRNTSAGVAWWRCRHRLCDNRGGAKESAVLPLAIDECIAAANHLAQVLMAPKDNGDPRREPLLQELEEAQAVLLMHPERKSAAMRVEELEADLRALETQPIAVDLESIQGMQELLEQPETWKGATPEELRTVLAQLLIEIKVGRGGDPITAIRRPY